MGGMAWIDSGGGGSLMGNRKMGVAEESGDRAGKAGGARLRVGLVPGLVVLLCLPLPGTAAAPPAQPVEFRVTSAGTEEDGDNKGGLNTQLRVRVSDLEGWLKKIKYKPGQLERILLYIRNRQVPGAHPIRIGLAGDRPNTLVFELRRTAESRDAWTAILARPLDWTQKVPVSVGFAEELPLPTDVNSFQLIVVRWDLVLLLVVFVFALALFGFLVLAVKSNILREDGPEPRSSNGAANSGSTWRALFYIIPVRQGPRKPYSLGRTQMAFWLFLVLASYLLLWNITRDRDTIPGSVLTLMGISAATALGAVVIDVSKRAAAQSNLDAARREQIGLQTRQPPAAPDEITVLQKRVDRLNQRLETEPSRGFFLDLVSETDGVSLHRFQICVWTLVLGIIFIVSVFTDLAMPTFGDTLLALMGISGATYVGFKWPDTSGAPSTS
jgi:hypothetical protein